MIISLDTSMVNKKSFDSFIISIEQKKNKHFLFLSLSWIITRFYQFLTWDAIQKTCERKKEIQFEAGDLRNKSRMVFNWDLKHFVDSPFKIFAKKRKDARSPKLMIYCKRFGINGFSLLADNCFFKYKFVRIDLLNTSLLTEMEIFSEREKI